MSKKDGQRISFTLTTTSDEITGQTYLQAKVLGRPLSVIGLFRTKLSNYEKILIEHYDSKSKYDKEWLNYIISQLKTTQLIKKEQIFVEELQYFCKKVTEDYETVGAKLSLLDCYVVIERARSQATNYGNI